MIKILCVGKAKEKGQIALIQEYVKRINGFHKLEVVELKEANPSFEDKKIIETETNQIISHLQPHDFVVVMDIVGQQQTSIQFSQLVDKWLLEKNVVFVIGGSLGVSETLKQRANYRLSFSLMTFPHILFRIMLLEQLYRSFKILSNQAYHK